MLQFKKHQQATATLRRLMANQESVLVVHYSCESFADRPDGRSPRVTSIAVRNLATGSTDSFSIHQVAERSHIPHAKIDEHYDQLERTMLKEFYDFASKRPTGTWAHWNMRDAKFGFPALAHRLKVLGGTPHEIPQERLVDVSRVFVAKYGVHYMKHPRLENLLDRNGITKLSFLTGQEEAAAFEGKHYFKLHESTLRKVDNLANLIERAAAGTLKTYSKWTDRHGISFKEIALAAQSHWLLTSLVIVLGVVGSVATLFGVSMKDCHSAAVPVAAPSGTVARVR